MSRCDYDGVFYRVFCVTLLATAFTFTVILTNVFIDIDGLLAKKGKQNHETTDNVEYKDDFKSSEATIPPDDVTTDNIFDKNYIDDQAEPSYRTKRSIGSRNIVSNYHKNKINTLAAQLTKLLENVNAKGEYSAEFNRDEETLDFDLIKPPIEYFSNYNEGRRLKSPEKDLHLAIHREPQENIIDNVDDIDIPSTINKLLRKMKNRPYTSSQAKDPEVMMKMIEIKPLDLNELKNKLSYSQENMKIPSKVRFKHFHHLKNIDREKLRNDEHKTVLKLKILGSHSKNEKKQKNYRVFELIPKHDQYYYLNKALECLRKYQTYNKEQLTFVSLDSGNKDRMKRQIKVRYQEDDATTPRIKPVRKTTKKGDDELYVEIETHFDGSGAKGERKKKLVKSLIDRIQKAIRSDDSSKSDGKKTLEHLQIKKRIQNPLKPKPKNVMKMSSVEHRLQNPINKMEEVRDIPQDGEVKSVDDLEEPYPNSFSVPNVENSPEAVNSEFNNILSSGIPQRIQVPINLRHQNMPSKLKNSYSDANNVTLFIKDIDGSGFSVGFNQYVDEPPDVDSMKLFSGLENLIKTYHKDYDQINNENSNVNEIEDSGEKRHELVKREVNQDKNHVLFRRSIEEVQNDYRTDAYNIIFDKKMLPFARYEDIINRPSRQMIPSHYEYKIRNYDYNPKNIKIFTKDIKIKAQPIVLNDEIFNKKMKPSEIFSLASLLFQSRKNREKRALNVQKITNLKSRIKLARYINTKNMETKALFYKNKRNKRNVDKIRIYASDQSQGPSRQSEENVYVLSGENLFTNRASMREIELPESDTGDEVAAEQRGDDAVPFVFDVPNSSSPNKEPNYITNIFDSKFGQNGLMSKYPHIFPSTAQESKEVQFANDNDFLFKRGNKQQLKLENLLGMRAGDNASPEKDGRIPDIVNAIMPSKSNYKVTVKILPKNLTNAPSGFKEMHTVINKTYNNNGVQYYSLVNVSEISKIEKMNKTKENEHVDENGNKSPADDAKVQEQEKNMKLLLALQKEKIEKQLLHLNKEKEGLESILRERDGIKERNIHDLFKEFTHLDSSKPSNDLEFLHDMSHLHIHDAATVEPITESNIILPITNHDIRIKLEQPKEPENNKVDTPAKDNEHLTNEILSQINKNTDILQCFLKKLTDKFDKSPSTTTRSPFERVIEEKHLRARTDLNDWGLHHLHDSFFNDHIPKNESHYTIPFVYAYQHPYLPPNKPPLPMAKIVYHGHIHANNLHKHVIDGRKFNPNTPKHNPTTNPGVHENNKFFIDSLARDVIVTQPKIVQKPEFPPAIMNATQI